MAARRHRTSVRQSDMIAGVSVAMGGREWIVPPLTLGQLRRLMPKVRQLSDVGAQMGEVQIGVLVEIVTTALRRNYPEVAPDTVEDLLDLGNAGAVLNAVLTGSGLAPEALPLGEAQAPGSAPGAGVGSGATIGDTSTAFSPPPAATAIRSSTR